MVLVYRCLEKVKVKNWAVCYCTVKFQSHSRTNGIVAEISAVEHKKKNKGLGGCK